MGRTGARASGSFSDRFAIVSFSCVIVCFTAYSWLQYLIRDRDVRFFPLLWDTDKFNDLLNYSGKMLHLERGAAFVGSGYPVFNYLAPAAFLYHALLSAAHPVAGFLSVVLGFFATLLLASAVLLIRAGLFRWDYALGLVALAISFPMLFVAYRANLEGIVWVIVTASLCLVLRRWYAAAAVLLGVAMGIKPFPVLLLLLFLVRRQYRAALLGIGVAAALVLAALTALGPGVMRAYRGLQAGVLLYTHDYIRSYRSPNEQQYAHGFVDAMRLLCLKAAWLTTHVPPEQFNEQPTPTWIPAAYAVAALLVAATMVWRLRTMPTLNQVLGGELALTLLPPSAADYTLCALYLPVLLLGFFLVTEVRAGRAIWSTRHMLLFVLPAAALLSPLNPFGFWSGLVRLLLLLVLSVGALTLPLATSAFDTDARLAPLSK